MRVLILSSFLKISSSFDLNLLENILRSLLKRWFSCGVSLQACWFELAIFGIARLGSSLSTPLLSSSSSSSIITVEFDRDASPVPDRASGVIGGSVVEIGDSCGDLPPIDSERELPRPMGIERSGILSSVYLLFEPFICVFCLLEDGLGGVFRLLNLVIGN